MYLHLLVFRRILRSTWQRIQALYERKDQKLSEILQESMISEPLAPILSQKHLDAIDRRLIKIVERIKDCFSQKGERNVLVAD